MDAQEAMEGQLPETGIQKKDGNRYHLPEEFAQCRGDDQVILQAHDKQDGDAGNQKHTRYRGVFTPQK